MEYAEGEGRHWRSEMQQWLKFHLKHRSFNPNEESKKYLSKRIDEERFRKLKSTDFETFSKLVRGIVALDSSTIARRVDYVICYWDESAQRGAGTQGEVTLAKYFGKPVFLVSSLPADQIPAWIIGCSSKIFRSFEELKAELSQRYSDMPPGGMRRYHQTRTKTSVSR
jgi:hypothetical protein